MKKRFLSLVTLLLVLVMVAGCGGANNAATNATTAPTVSSTTVPTTPPDNGGGDTEDNSVARYINEVYAQQIARYDAALTEQWDEGMYLDNGLSLLPCYYYEGNPLNNVGFSILDLDQDGRWELVIGAILNAERDPAIFEIWTVVDGQPVMLAQGSSENRYMLRYGQEDLSWHIVNDVSNNMASRGTYCLELKNGKFEVVQGVVFDAFADEENPWFKTRDLDWDTSNDEHIDEQTADAILDSYRKFYIAPDYIPYASRQLEPAQTTKEKLIERAEELSQRFGVDIRIPAQSEISYTHYHGYELTNLSYIRSALDIMEENFARYPEGFLRQLTYGPIESVRIELVGGLTVKEGVDIDPGSVYAFAQNKDSYYLIVMNGYFVNPTTLFHEFSHVIDSKLNWDCGQREDALFNEATWVDLQPEGFRFAWSYTKIPEELHTYLETDYFWSWYSMTYPTEDRATLMASAMTNNRQDFEPGSGRSAKMQYYADCIRDCFDTTGWPEVTLWEQVLTTP